MKQLREFFKTHVSEFTSCRKSTGKFLMAKDKYIMTVSLTLHCECHLRRGRTNAVTSCAFVPPLISLANIPDAQGPGWAERVPVCLRYVHVVFDPCYDWFRSAVSGTTDLNCLTSRHDNVCRRLHDRRWDCWKEALEFSLLILQEIYGKHQGELLC